MVWSLQLKAGSLFILAGPTMAGKTTFVCSLLRYRTFMFGWIFKRIIVFTPHAQSKYENLRNENVVNEIYHELPTIEDLDIYKYLLLVQNDTRKKKIYRSSFSTSYKKIHGVTFFRL